MIRAHHGGIGLHPHQSALLRRTFSIFLLVPETALEICSSHHQVQLFVVTFDFDSLFCSVKCTAGKCTGFLLADIEFGR